MQQLIDPYREMKYAVVAAPVNPMITALAQQQYFFSRRYVLSLRLCSAFANVLLPRLPRPSPLYPREQQKTLARSTMSMALIIIQAAPGTLATPP